MLKLDEIIKGEPFILQPTAIGGKSRGFLIPKKRMKLDSKKKYMLIIVEVDELCKQLIY